MKKAVILLSAGITLFGAGCSAADPLALKADTLRAALNARLNPPVFSMQSAASSTEPGLIINIMIPTVTSGLSSFEARNTFNDRMADDAFKLVSTFRAEFADPEMAINRESSLAWSLTTDAVVPTGTSRIQSTRLNGYQYTGGAHGLMFHVTEMFDLKKNTFLTVEDLFEPRINVYAQLAEQSQMILMNREYVKDDPEWVRTGTEAKPENYQTVYATNEGLVVIFSDYQVGPHVIGPQEVLIPWDKLQGVKQEYRP